MTKRRLLFILLLALFVLVASLLFYPDYDNPRMIKFLIITQVLFALSLGIFFVGRRFDFLDKNRSLFYASIAVAIAVRVIMIVGSGDHLYLSDDLYRYLWDGKVNVSGINPYLYEPAAVELEHLVDDKIHPKINHDWLPTIYPPMAQNIFALSHIVGGQSIATFKWICFLFELLTIAALMVWLHLSGVKRANLLLYLFSPLIIIEFFLSAHLDILALPFLISAFILVVRGRPVLSGLLLALAVLIKFYGLIFFPFILLIFQGKKRWLFGGSLLATMVAMYLPYMIGSEGRFLGSLFEYIQNWQSNASAFLALRWSFGFDTARYLAAGIFLIWFLYQLFWRGSYANNGNDASEGKEVWDRQFSAFGGYIVLTPVLFPWYLIWIFPLLLRNLSVPFIYLSGSILLTYELYISRYASLDEAVELGELGESVEILWVRLLVYIPFYCLLIYQAIKQRKAQHGR